MPLPVFGVHINKTNPRTPPTAVVIRSSAFLVSSVILIEHRLLRSIYAARGVLALRLRK